MLNVSYITERGRNSLLEYAWKRLNQKISSTKYFTHETVQITK